MAHAGQHELAAEPGRDVRRARGVGALASLVTAILAVVGLTTWLYLPGSGGVGGTPIAANGIRTDGTDAVPVSRVPAGDFTDRMVGQEQLVAGVIADVAAFWSGRLPTIAGVEAHALRGGVTALDSAAPSGTVPCVARPADITGNAYYCPTDDGIVYDAGVLVPVVLERYGIAGLVATFAHEYGHAIAAQLADAGVGTEPPPTPLTSEARADCSAGAFAAWAVAGKAAHVQMDEDMLLRTVRPLVDFADQADVDPDDPTAHGLAIDRLSWFAGGYREGAEACLTLTAVSAVSGFPPTPSTSQTRYADRAALTGAATASITAFLGVGAGMTPEVAASVTGAAAAAVAALDDPSSAVAAAWQRVAPDGQFAQATVLALQAGTSVGDTACVAGAWARSVYGHAEADSLGGWPGDADEGLRAVLSDPHATWQSAVGYLDGFTTGLSACH